MKLLHNEHEGVLGVPLNKTIAAAHFCRRVQNCLNEQLLKQWIGRGDPLDCSWWSLALAGAKSGFVSNELHLEQFEKHYV